MSHPPNTINGRFRLTEQGEMSAQNYGDAETAEMTFDLLSAGVLSERFEPRPPRCQEWNNLMAFLAEKSNEKYQQVVREDPRFIDYFKNDTPELELMYLNVGSQPAAPREGGIESVRAIPWVIAWNQCRLNLAGWLGTGVALRKANLEFPGLLRSTYTNWPWFRSMIDLVEMVLAKTDTQIAQNYDDQLVTDANSLELGAELRKTLESAIVTVLEVSGHPKLQSLNPYLLDSLSVRSIHIDVLNVLQVELLLRLRTNADISPTDKRILRDALLVTVNGIAIGLRNTE